MTDTQTIEVARESDVEPAQEVRAEPARPRPRVAPSRVRVVLAGLAVFGAIILAITLWPQPVDQGMEGTVERVLHALHTLGVPTWFEYGALEFSANVIMFVPLGFFVALLLPRRYRWLALVIPTLVSGAVEVAQLLFLENRFATLLDVLANSLGGWLGAAIAFLIVRK